MHCKVLVSQYSTTPFHFAGASHLILKQFPNIIHNNNKKKHDLSISLYYCHHWCVCDSSLIYSISACWFPRVCSSGQPLPTLGRAMVRDCPPQCLGWPLRDVHMDMVLRAIFVIGTQPLFFVIQKSMVKKNMTISLPFSYNIYIYA